jgi:citronellol/citronellal dehydrogenase
MARETDARAEFRFFGLRGGRRYLDLEGRTLFISGGSRGIGLAIATRAAREGANVVIAAKTVEPHPKLKGTIYTAAEQIEADGGRALPLVPDVRDADAIHKAVAQAVAHFGGIDAPAPSPTPGGV